MNGFWHWLSLRPLRPFASFAFPITGPSFRTGEKYAIAMTYIIFGDGDLVSRALAATARKSAPA
jgi:predicted NAD-dependent protein-ADP-ribosyltransferase YbiA (DUF1768 family)